MDIAARYRIIAYIKDPISELVSVGDVCTLRQRILRVKIDRNLFRDGTVVVPLDAG